MIVYFHTDCHTYNNYSVFRRIVRNLPLKYLLKLKALLVMNPSLTVRAMEWFVSGAVNKHLNGITKVASTFNDLRDFGVRVEADDVDLFPRRVWEELNSDIKVAHNHNPREKKQIFKKTVNQPHHTPQSVAKVRLEDYVHS